MTVREFWNTTSRETMICLIDGDMIGWATGRSEAIIDFYRNYTDLNIFGDLKVRRVVAAGKNRINLIIEGYDR